MKYKEWLDVWFANYIEPSSKTKTCERYSEIKESPTIGLSTMESSGIPASSSGGEKVRGERVTDKRARRYITITDRGAWEYIDKIMMHPDYGKSFNKVINSALLFGLPELYKRLFDTVEIDGEEQTVSVPNEYNENAFYFQLIRLMKEMLANEVITKSVVCSLFNERAEVLDRNASDAYSLKKGFYQDTPEYLVNEEIRMLKDVGR